MRSPIVRAFLITLLLFGFSKANFAQVAGDVVPYVMGLDYDPDTKRFTAHFNAVNSFLYPILYPVGIEPYNYFSPPPADRGQSHVFPAYAALTDYVGLAPTVSWVLGEEPPVWHVRFRAAATAPFLGPVITLEQQKTQLQTQVNTLQQQNTQLQNLSSSSVGTVQQDLQSAVRDPQFTIPGATPSQQLQNLIQAITQLDPGSKRLLYRALGGKQTP